MAKDFEPKNFGLGKNTHSFVNQFENAQISGFANDSTNLVATIKKFRGEGSKTFLWLGASQLHSINQPKPGDKLAVTYANKASAKKSANRRYVQLSEPNANFHELWAMLYAVIAKTDVDGVILGFTYDDLNETGLRKNIIPLYRASPIEPALLEEQQSVANAAELDTNKTPQAWLENILVDQIEGRLMAFQKRGLIRAYIEAMYKNWIVRAVFAVKKKPQVRLVPDRQKWNEKAFSRIQQELARRNIPLIVYQAPHQPGMKPFYHPRKPYDDYHTNLSKTLTSSKNSHYLNFETIVDSPHWGINAAGQPDVFHFTVVGHRILGKAIDEAIQKLEVDNAL